MGDLGAAREEAGFSAYKVRKHLADSLRRLQTDRIDVYQVHHIDKRVSAEELWGGPTSGSSVTVTCSTRDRAARSRWGVARAQMQAWQRPAAASRGRPG